MSEPLNVRPDEWLGVTASDLLERAIDIDIKWKGPAIEPDAFSFRGKVRTRETVSGLLVMVRWIPELDRYQWQVVGPKSQVLAGSPFGDEFGLPEDGWAKAEAWLRLHAVLNEE